MQAAIQLSKAIDEFYAAIQDSGGDDALDPAVLKLVAAPLCKLTKMIIPNVHQKIDEVAYADDHMLIVCEDQHGADLHDSEGNSFELKVSVCTSRANFNWNIPAGTTSKNRRSLLKSVETKTEGGGAIFVVKSKSSKLLAEYKFSSAFLLAYFARVPLGSSKNHNMGCKQCTNCRKFHRLDKLQQNNDLFEENPGGVDWNSVFAPTAANCS